MDLTIKGRTALVLKECRYPAFIRLTRRRAPVMKLHADTNALRVGCVYR